MMSLISASAILADSAHRPWPVPRGPWVMEQGWYNLLFAHWRVPAAELRALVPPQLELDTFEGDMWLSITPLFIRMRPRFAFGIGRAWYFPELNCRTYVRHKGRAGIFFFSLDARSPLAVVGARMSYRLPYFHAEMRLTQTSSGVRFFSERRSTSRYPSPPAVFRAEYEPVSAPQFPEPGTLEHFLTERYCLYTVAGGRVWSADIHHARWPLQQVRGEIFRNNVAAAAGITLSGPPEVTHLSAVQEVLIWPLRSVE